MAGLSGISTGHRPHGSGSRNGQPEAGEELSTPTRSAATNALLASVPSAPGSAPKHLSVYPGHTGTVMVASPAVIIAGLNLVAGSSLPPHIASLAAIPLGVTGIVVSLLGQSHRILP